MSRVALSAPPVVAWRVADWLPAAGLLLATGVLGPALGSIARPLFILGCAGVGWFAWKRGAAVHLQSVILLFTFASLVRRLVDLSAGYEPSGLMLVGPLLAILAPLADLPRLLGGRNMAAEETRANPQVWPIAIVGACVLYATALSLFQGDWMNAASGALKWTAPLVYAFLLGRCAKPEELVQAAASVFLVVLPLTGLYGIIQYVNPPQWDRYWMTFATILSAGQPLPYQVRTFSTMNGPASFATFTAAGLLLVFFLRPGLRALLVSAPAAMSLLLSTYRTAWISLALGVLFAGLFRSTRGRAVRTLAAIVLAVVAASIFTPFGDVIGERLSSFGQGSNDGSARERLDEFVQLWQTQDSGVFGSGFTVTDVGSAGAMAIDGMFITCWVSMGIFVGLACLTALTGAAVNAIAACRRDGRAEMVVVGALACGALSQMPLANIATGELGFLFWTFVVLLPGPPRPRMARAW